MLEARSRLKGSGLMALGGIGADNGGWIGVGPLRLPKPPKGTAFEPYRGNGDSADSEI